MFQTAFTHNLTQFARILSLPERLQHTPARNLSLEALRQRNTTLDAFFYDIKVVTPDEAFYISDSLAAVGSILIVPPSGAGALILCDTLDEFFLRGGKDIHVLAIAGAGGSALGAAAFARNVADAVGEPVATVVPGYGFADAVGEAMGGSFLFGWLNQVRHGFEILDEVWGRPQFGVNPETNAAASTVKHNCRDMQTVLALLADPRLAFNLLTGHSKGNLVLAEALTRLKSVDLPRLQALSRSARIVTFGAKIAMPPVFTDVIDVIGEWDWFGTLNSRQFIATDRKVSGAWHHTNTDLPGHIAVTEVLKEILAQPPALRPVETAPSETVVSGEVPVPPAEEPVPAATIKVAETVAEDAAPPAESVETAPLPETAEETGTLKAENDETAPKQRSGKSKPAETMTDAAVTPFVPPPRRKRSTTRDRSA
ncbi:hypothetical protein DEM27_04155 [Metarhizobium album]|uniref:Cell envelope biogenesis protein OmpA n=1 Tax=Metarhizobium album TaxID=2182425 RepID=A0A2U2DUE9_9HYPH|nr:hypothetical protein [Rhizobium album]PWE56849.1 hypothetical protein DEM27_04155 [Rhizobium album]